MMQAERVKLDEWDLAGGGANGLSYFKKDDDSIILKLNATKISAEKTEEEYLRSKAVHELGIRCPAVYSFVTDGERYGMTGERIRGKESYARIISNHPERLAELATDFAARCLELHAKECDTNLFNCVTDTFRSSIEGCDKLPDSVKMKLGGYLDCMEKVTTCLHGDMQPGNIIRAAGKDYWIDLGNWAYGDPDMDMAGMLTLNRYTPVKVVDNLFHISAQQFRNFTEVFGYHYYGNRWGTAELSEKLDMVAAIKLGAVIAARPVSAPFFLPFIEGKHLWRGKLMLKLANLFVKEV